VLVDRHRQPHPSTLCAVKIVGHTDASASRLQRGAFQEARRNRLRTDISGRTVAKTESLTEGKGPVDPLFDTACRKARLQLERHGDLGVRAKMNFPAGLRGKFIPA